MTAPSKPVTERPRILGVVRLDWNPELLAGGDQPIVPFYAQSGALVVTDYAESEGGYAITHAPTGKRIGGAAGPWKTVREASKAVRALDPLKDWSRVTKSNWKPTLAFSIRAYRAMGLRHPEDRCAFCGERFASYINCSECSPPSSEGGGR